MVDESLFDTDIEAEPKISESEIITETVLRKDVKSPRLAISGSVGLNSLEAEIVDTEEFQRLHKIKELENSYLVYPSATHDRFEHSLGTLDMAKFMIQKIKSNEWSEQEEKTIPWEDEVIIRLAALLHDVTHVPFSHTLEDQYSLIKKHDEDEERLNYFLELSKIGQILQKKLGKVLHKRLLKVLRTDREDVEEELGPYAYISDIVKNTICADLFDYIRRDTFYCNLYERIGHRLLDYMFIFENDDKSVKRLVFRLWKGSNNKKDDSSWPRGDILSEMRDLLRVRFALGQKVYFHHTKIIASAMVARAIQEVLKPYYTGKNPLELKVLREIGDDELISFLAHSKNDVAEKLSHNLSCRKLHKRIPYEESMSAASSKSVNWKEIILNKYHYNPTKPPHTCPQYRRYEEDRLAGLVGLEPGDVLIWCPSEEMQLKEAEMLITWQGKIQQLQQITDKEDELTYQDIKLIKDSHEALWSFQVFVTQDIEDDQRLLLKDLCHALFDPLARGENVANRLEPVMERILTDRMIKKGINTNKLQTAREKLRVLLRNNQEITSKSIDGILENTK